MAVVLAGAMSSTVCLGCGPGTYSTAVGELNGMPMGGWD